MSKSSSRDALDFQIDEVKNLSTTIADRLSEMIKEGQLRPGERLVQVDLANNFGVSRVAIRDALQHLRQRGLVINVQWKGTIVRPVSCKTVEDLFNVRAAVESLATVEACSKMTKKDITALHGIIDEQVELVRSSDFKSLIPKDWDFHRTIYNRCDNELLKDIIVGLWERMHQARSLAQANREWGQSWGQNSIARHRALLECLEKGNCQDSGEIMRETIHLAAEGLLKGLRDSGWGWSEENDTR